MASEKEILQYLDQHDYIDVYIFLINSFDNLRNRGLLLENGLGILENSISEALKTIEENPDVDPRDRKMSNLIKGTHYAELEVILKLNIMIELLAIYYHFNRTNLRELSKAVGRRDISPAELYREFGYFKSQSLRDIQENLRYPDVESFHELSEEEKRILNILLENSSKQIQTMFQKLNEFQEKFRPIYNKYKHTLSEITGVYGVNKEARRLESQIFMRIKQDGDIKTYIVGSGLEELKYLQAIGGMAYKILSVTIDSALLFLTNLGKSFIPRTLFIEDNSNEFKKIAEKIKSCRVPNFESILQVPMPDQKTQEKLNREITAHHVYVMNKDVMNPRNILKGGVQLAGKTKASIEEK